MGNLENGDFENGNFQQESRWHGIRKLVLFIDTIIISFRDSSGIWNVEKYLFSHFYNILYYISLIFNIPYSEKYVSGNSLGIGVQNFYKIEQVLTFSNVD